MKNILQKIFISLLLIVYIFIPLKSPLKSGEKDKKIYTVIIDAGHGGKDPGTIGLSGVYEKNIVLPITLKLRDYLSKEYFDMKIVLTRDKDEFIELKQRGHIANNEEGNLFVSIHCNAKKNDENDKSGFELYLLDLSRIDEAKDITFEENKFIAKYENTDSLHLEENKIIVSMYQQMYLKYSEKFASILETELIKGGKLLSRGVRQEGFWVLLSASMPTLLVECGYLSNKSDEDYLKSEKGQEEIAKSIYKAIRYFKMDYDFENAYLER